MFLTRSIRRKMVTGFALVLSMLIALGFSGLYALHSYCQALSGFEASVYDTPRRNDLVASLGRLVQPLQLTVQDVPEAQQFQQREFERRLPEVDAAVNEFARKLESLPPSAGVVSRQQVTQALLYQIRQQLAEFDNPRTPWNPQTRLQQVIALQSLALEIPDPQEGMHGLLQQNRRLYRALTMLNTTIIVAVVVLFVALVGSSYRLIFGPLRRLHQGAARVAQGDFDFRVSIRTTDEMGQLAESFNKMTDRFLEIKNDLDRQVCERSRQLVRSERLAGVGFLAAGVAHEINNPLSAIVMACDSLAERVDDMLADVEHPDKPVVASYLNMIRQESFRCRDITARLLDFSRGQNARKELNDLTKITREVIAMVGHLGKFRDREIAFDHEQPCLAEVVGPEIKQVVLNLVANALESMDSGGRLVIRITEQTDDVLLTFTDDGCGMTAEVIDNLFEPFFTQRRTGRGTGLGLSISHRIIADHGGTIEATSPGEGEGSTFQIHLPRRARAERAA